jgi:hypothetical protein
MNIANIPQINKLAAVIHPGTFGTFFGNNLCYWLTYDVLHLQEKEGIPTHLFFE